MQIITITKDRYMDFVLKNQQLLYNKINHSLNYHKMLGVNLIELLAHHKFGLIELEPRNGQPCFAIQKENNNYNSHIYSAAEEYGIEEKDIETILKSVYEWKKYVLEEYTGLYNFNI